MRFFSLLAALDSDLNLLSVMVDPLILFRLTPLTFITNLLPLDLALPFPCSALPLLLCPSLCLCFNFLFHIKTLKHFHKKRAVTWAIKNQKHSWKKKRGGGGILESANVQVPNGENTIPYILQGLTLCLSCIITDRH